MSVDHRAGGFPVGKAMLCLLGILSCAVPNAHAQSPFRFDDDVSSHAQAVADGGSLYDHFKYIPLGGGADRYLSFGGDLRERVETSGNGLLGFRNPDANAYDLSRLLLFADLQFDHFRAFVQLGSHLEAGRAPGALPTDVDRVDLQQAFADYATGVGPGWLTLRGGRFEMSFDGGALIGLRDGPNVRQAWDGFQTFYTLGSTRLDAFVVKPVDVSPGYFDDGDVHGQTLWGWHVDAAPAGMAPFKFTAFYYGNTMPKVLLSPRPGREETHTAGLRVLAAQGSFDGAVGIIGQLGTFSGEDVRAWAAHGDVGWTLSAVPWTPRLGLRVDALSGGDNTHGTVHTFNALYPNYAYSTEATIEAPANLVQVGAILSFRPVSPVTVHYTLEGNWRYSTRDAFYAAPDFALVHPDGTNRRFSGVEQQLEGTWHINPLLDLTGAFVRFDPAAFLKSAHARTEDFGMVEISFHF